MLNIILFGPPGAGKGTHSEKLIAKYGLVHISTGDLLRSEKAKHTELGLLAKQYIDHGQLVPDEIVIGMIRNKLKETPSAPGYIFDGFPRTVVQAEALDTVMTELGQDISVVVSLEVSEVELVKRLVKRGETSGRSDDNEETAHKRYAIYKKETSPVALYYAAQGKLVTVDGLGNIEDIFGRIFHAISVTVKEKAV